RAWIHASGPGGELREPGSDHFQGGVGVGEGLGDLDAGRDLSHVSDLGPERTARPLFPPHPDDQQPGGTHSARHARHHREQPSQDRYVTGALRGGESQSLYQSGSSSAESTSTMWSMGSSLGSRIDGSMTLEATCRASVKSTETRPASLSVSPRASTASLPGLGRRHRVDRRLPRDRLSEASGHRTPASFDRWISWPRRARKARRRWALCVRGTLPSGPTSRNPLSRHNSGWIRSSGGDVPTTMSLGKTVRTEPPYSRRTLTPCPSRAPDRSCQSYMTMPGPVRDPRLHRAGRVVYLQGEHRRKGGKAVTYTICEPCFDVQDTGCVDECPVDCIYERPRMLYIHPDECFDCGACQPVCPVTTIFYDDDVPAEWKQLTPINAGS